MDFLEIASYVFAGDCSTRRGEWTDEKSEEPWTRDFAFHIAVREPEFWADAKIMSLLQKVLGFLSNDVYSFTFVPLARERRVESSYFEFGELSDWPFHKPARVVMFSGGLDSLAGAVETAVSGVKSVLISHRPVSTLDARQRKLVRELQKRFPGQFVHIPVWINKAEKFGREPTQRTRSFLFAALGTLVAQSVEAGGVRFYENGILSLNLPLAQEALRSRASRTTHPVALQLLGLLAAAITERELAMDNPFSFKTKAEVVGTIETNRVTELVPLTCSCSHLMFQSSVKHHCGVCSQCIDRRVALAGAGLLASDPITDYVADVFTGARPKQLDRSIAIDYALHGIELDRQSETEIASTFNAEITRAVRYEARRGEAAQSIISMHKRHGSTVRRVLEEQLRLNAPKLIDRTLESNSLLGLIIGERYLPRSDGESSQSASGKLLSRLEEEVLNRIANPSAATRPKRSAKSGPNKRETILFAAILSNLEGLRYCSFLDRHKVRPKWADEGPSGYRSSYLHNAGYKKKVQDEKSRAKKRMDGHTDPMLADAFVTYLPTEFETLSQFLDSRNSPRASKFE